MRDFKSAQAGEKGEAIGRGLEPEDLESIFAAPEDMNEADEQPPTFEDEPWPDLLEEEQGEGPALPREQNVQELAKTAGHSMIDGVKAPAPRIPERVKGELAPSDKSWLVEIKRIFGKDLER